MPTEKKKTTKETTAKNTTAKKAIAKKTTTKKPPAKVALTKKPTAKKTTAKKPPAKGATTKKSTVKKTTAEPKSNFLLPKIDINSIINNITSLPLMIRTGISGFPLETTYFDTDMCKNGLYYLVHINGKYFLLLPKWNERVLHEMETGKHIVITRGNYERQEDSFEIMFDDDSETPF
jgi:hypothetical protein